MSRIERAKEILKDEDLEALIVDNPIDLYYLTGLSLSLGRLVIGRDEALLFVDGRYFEDAKKRFPHVLLTKGYGLDTPFAKAWPFSGKKVGFDSTYTSYETYLDLLSLKSPLKPLKSPIKFLREIKEPKEIEILKKAAALGSRGYDFVIDLLKEGITEEEVAVELEIFWKKTGGEKLAFHPHIAFGENSAYPHGHPQKKALTKGEEVLADIGVVQEHYHSDMTRVVFFKEIKNSELEKIYMIVKEAQAKALDQCRPGVEVGVVDLAARNHITQKGYGNAFVHSLGHGVGLEIHEYPTLRSTGEEAKRKLKEGMVVTIEPGIYIPGLGGVRLEDTIVITKGGFENLTQRPLSLSLPIIP